jgi:glycerophosphoryl diester phosphodiesterase
MLEFMNSGHRGAMSLAPENTMASFALAIECGANEIELDLQLSKDGVLVVMHDETVDRTTNGTGVVKDLTYEQLAELDAGSGERIPAFTEVIAAIHIPIQVELKDPDTVEPFAQLIDDQPDLLPRLSPCSQNIDIMADVVERLPAAIAGYTTKIASSEALEQAHSRGARRVLFGWSGTTDALIARAHELGMHYGLWPVNTSEQLNRAVELGVDGFTTDDPRLVRQNGYELRDGALVHVAA